MALHTRVVLLLPFVLLTPALAQSVAPTLGESVKPIATPEKHIFKAGEDISVTLTLGIAAPRDLQIHAQSSYCAGTYLQFTGTVRKGESTATVKSSTDSLLPDANNCVINQFQIDAPPHLAGETNVVTATTVNLPSPVQFEIVGVPRVAETLDMKVTAEVNLSERQFLRSRAVNVRSYRQDVLSYLDKNANETPAYYDFLLHTLTDARDELLRTRQVFVTRYRPNGDHPPYFDDLQRRYDALISDVQRRGGKLAHLDETKARFFTVQVLQHRPRPLEDEPNSSNFSGTYPPDANEALDILNWNVGVYLDIANNGKDVFVLTIASWPADATVSAKRIGEEYTVLGQKTTITQAKFPFALWTFKFAKPGCRDYFQIFDPVHDTSPNLDAELECGR